MGDSAVKEASYKAIKSIWLIVDTLDDEQKDEFYRQVKKDINSYLALVRAGVDAARLDNIGALGALGEK